MGSKDFEAAMAIVLELEGGYSDDPNDAGKATNHGISQAAFPHVDIKNLTLSGARDIYREHYWDKYRCGEMPWPLAMCFFDSVVQFNPLNPIRWLQGAVLVLPDGRLGPRTIAAARECKDPAQAALRIMQERGEYRTRHAKYSYFGKGWRKRDLRVLYEAVRTR